MKNQTESKGVRGCSCACVVPRLAHVLQCGHYPWEDGETTFQRVLLDRNNWATQREANNLDLLFENHVT